MRILLFGGSFDPPHRGHAQLFLAALRHLGPDRAYLIPAYQSPLKSGHHASPVHRFRMAGILKESLPAPWRKRVDVSRFELRRKRPSHTFQTLRYFKAKHPSAELYFLTGSDSLASFPFWKRAGELQRNCRWVAGRRLGSAPAKRNLPAHETLPGYFPPVSSTDARCRLIAGLPTQGILADKVLAYILSHGLYGTGIQRELRRTLSAERFAHTLEVARLASSLAFRHGLDPEAAATAGLLHDAGRRFRPDHMARYALRHNLSVPSRAAIIRNAPLLLHAYISEDLARKRFGVKDPMILSAIRNHTLGAVGMKESDRLLYVADTASEDRGFAGAARIRKLALRDLKTAFKLAVRTKLSYVEKNGLWMHPDSRKVLAWSRR